MIGEIINCYERKQAIENLKDINSLCDSKEEGMSPAEKTTFIVQHFGDVITGLAGYLDNRHSQRTLSIVNEFLLKLNKRFYGEEDSTTDFKLSLKTGT